MKCYTRHLQDSDFFFLFLFWLFCLVSRSAQLFMHCYLQGNKHAYLDTLIMET